MGSSGNDGAGGVARNSAEADLYERHADAVSRFVSASGGPADEHDDVVQETWVRVLRYDRPLPEDESGQRRFLHAISRNLVRDRWRSRQRDAARRHKLADPSAAIASPADEAVLRDERSAALRAAFARLDRRQQDVLRMRIVEGRSAAEVADVLGLDAPAVRMIQFRALAALRKQLQPSAFAERTPNRGGPR